VGAIRWLTAVSLFALDLFGVIALFLVFRDVMSVSVLLTIPLILGFLFMTIVVPVFVVAYVVLGPVERSVARVSLGVTRSGGYIANYPGLPVRFADYRPGSPPDHERRT